MTLQRKCISLPATLRHQPNRQHHNFRTLLDGHVWSFDELFPVVLRLGCNPDLASPRSMSDHPHFAAADAYKLLASELAAYREFTYEELAECVGEPTCRIVRAHDSTEYAIEVTVCWLNEERGDILVDGWVAVDDCGPMRRLDERFIVRPPIGEAE